MIRNDVQRAAYLTDYWTLRDDLRFSDFCYALLQCFGRLRRSCGMRMSELRKANPAVPCAALF